jgi:hypothetical protein
MEEVGLRLHPDKTKIVYCKDWKRRGEHEHISFTFLGYTFRPRKAQGRDGRSFLGFLPAISKNALKKISAEVRSWRLYRSDKPGTQKERPRTKRGCAVTEGMASTANARPCRIAVGALPHC